MLAGVVGGYLLMKFLFGAEAHIGGMLIGALLAGIVTVAMIGFVTRTSRVKQDTAIGIMYTGIFALGAFAVSLKALGKHIHIDVVHFIVGSVISVGNAELWIAGIVAAIVIAVVVMFFRQLQLTSFDPVMAASIGMPVLAVEYLLTACTSLVVVSGVRIAGVILVVALIITPAASAYLLFDRLSRMLCASAVIGVISFWLGFALASVAGASPGPAIVLVGTFIFLATLAFAPHYGLLADWLRIRNSIPQEVKEDVLGVVLRHAEPWISISEVLKRVQGRNPRIRNAVGALTRQDLLERRGHEVSLTSQGRREARRLLRAHRIWETYLEHMGTPSAEIHPQAHRLEHLNDEETIDYLDDKLGHPLTDPHGSEIPEDFIDLESQKPFRASLLRRGHEVEISHIEAPARELGLTVGMIVKAAPRSADGEIWTLITPNGKQVKLDHQQADAVFVRRIGQSVAEKGHES